VERAVIVDGESHGGALGGGWASEPSGLTRILANRSLRAVLTVYAFAIVLFFCARFVSPSYGSFNYLWNVLVVATFIAVTGFGQGVVVLAGGLDLSIPGVVAFVGVVFTQVSGGSGTRAIWVVPLVLLLGAGLGLANGIGVFYLRLAPVVATLASNVILAGVVLVYTNGTPKGTAPGFVVHLAQSQVLGNVPILVFFLLGFTILGVALLNGTVFGRYLYAVGSSRETAFLSAVPISRTVVSSYAVSGFCSAVAAILLTGYANQSYLGMGDPYLLLSLAAVVVGGSAISGGRGYFLGTLAGAFILATASTMLSGTTLPEAVKQIVYAVAILVAVLATRQKE
jgi:ribose transport system permease protein